MQIKTGIQRPEIKLAQQRRDQQHQKLAQTVFEQAEQDAAEAYRQKQQQLARKPTAKAGPYSASDG